MNAPSHVPQSILELDKIYFAHFDALHEAQVALDSIRNRLCGAMDYDHERIETDVELRDFLDEDIERYVRRVRSIAKEELSEPLAPFEADNIKILEAELRQVSEVHRQVYDRKPQDVVEAARAACAACSPVKVWQALKKHHDPAAQNRVAAMIHANALGRELAPHLYRSGYGYRPEAPKEMKIVKGRAEVCLWVHTEKRWSGRGRRFANDSTVRTFAKAMDFALQQGNPGSAFTCGRNLLALCNAYQASQRELISRERINLQDGVDIVAGFEQFKLYLPLDIASSLNLFIAEYGNPGAE